MSIKISELTPKGANLEATDLLEISESTADGYSSKSITGAEIITASQEGMQVGLVSGSNIKTINSTSLLGSGDLEVQPTLVSGTNIKTINGNSLLGSGDLTISGGGGLTIGTTAITSGTVGRVLFEGTGNVVQESSQLSWNNTTNALTITTGKTFSAYQSSQPNDALKLEVNNLGAVFAVQNSNSSGFSGIEYLSNTGVARVFTGFNNGNGQEFRFNNFATGGYIDFLISTSALRIANTRNILIGTTTDAGYKLDVNGTARVSGNLTFGSSTSYLYGDTNNIRLYDKNNRIILQCYPSGVLNSETSLTSGTSTTSSLRLRDDYASIEFSNTNSSSTVQNPIQFIKGYFGNIGATDKSIVTIKSVSYSNLTNATLLRGLYIDINDTTTYTGFTTFRAIESKKGGAYFNTTSANSSAILQADSTTQGFLPPRMTNAQMLAIATPASGLMVYDTTNNKMCVYDGTAWQNLY